MYLTQSLHRAVQQNPDGIATIFGDRVRSFVEQADRVARLAGALRRLGVESGDRVAYLGLNSDRFIEYYLAVPWADAVLNPVNVRWSPAEIAYSLEDSQTRVLLVDDAFIPLLPAIRDRYIELNTLIYVGDAGPLPGMLGYEELVAAGPAVDDVRRGGDAMAALFYTGGTTGFPKGVMLSHANLLTSALGSMATGGFGSWERFLYAVPMFHLAGLGAFIGVGLAGGTHRAGIRPNRGAGGDRAAPGHRHSAHPNHDPTDCRPSTTRRARPVKPATAQLRRLPDRAAVARSGP